MTTTCINTLSLANDAMMLLTQGQQANVTSTSTAMISESEINAF
jgi:hypothetical protein